MPMKNYQKPWPRRKAVGDDELVKYMSTVPLYLQHMEKGDCSQERALNVGVLDWGLLEKWAYNQKIFAAGRGQGFIVKKQTLSSHSVQTTKAEPLTGENCKHSIDPPDGRCLSRNTPVDQTHMDKVPKKHPDDQGTRTKFVTFSPNAMNAQDRRSREFEKAETYEKQKCSDNHRKQQKPAGIPLASDDRPQNQEVAAVHEDTGKTPNNLQGNVHRRVASVIQETFLLMVHTIGNYPLLGLIRVPSFLPPNTINLMGASTINATPTMNSNGKHEKRDDFSGMSRELFNVFMAQGSGEDLVKASGLARGREFSLNHQSSPGQIWHRRSSSLREGSNMHQMRSVASSENPHVDKVSPQSKGRRSPLRRLLDPLVKAKERSSVSGPIACATTRHTNEWNDCKRSLCQDGAVDGSIKLGMASMNSSKCQAECNHNSSNEVVSMNNSTSTLDEKHVPSRRQALLQLAWKNGLPLFMFSSNNNDILAATVKEEKLIPIKMTFECVYTIFSVSEVKKKSGIWINQGNKSKKHGLASDIVGQIKVSHGSLTEHDSKSHVLIRKKFCFIWLKSYQTAHEPIDSVFSKELAAVVVKAVEDNKCDDQDRSLHNEDYVRTLNLASIVAILPSGFHGSSTAGEPSPLIERWKSGGLCDCGGWDEGCALTILRDKNQDNKNSPDGTHLIELFYQKRKCALRMVAFREGLYTVDFRSSISLLQAFVICIATLHSKNPPHLSKLLLAEPNNFEEHVLSDHLRSSTRRHPDDPTRCVPNHPPISSVERD
ncbi:LOW QUALITY PROTEIN: uncharacterized protein LOC120282989 [Dioscorea cayenensis subsp. rotundata]|uniref:LOW QUALITY PROTEIN: uncharacterized protein LOC120282989 n=1 Tax=Dioscorea cayennensis subsp. rotundata TaxID=55577 RepID=A0AB40D0N5_DIOCR|nr:LOW QUALITY PROTEIN: uncharacterized protein LOC120282989 [Dioscorea cayenensis subsp. rotundata]